MSMILITAIVKPFKLEEVKDGLQTAGAKGMTVTELKGFGRQRGQAVEFAGSEYTVDFLPKIKVEVLCEDLECDALVEVIIRAAYTGKIGDGKIWVTPVQQVHRVRTKEKGPEAI